MLVLTRRMDEIQAREDAKGAKSNYALSTRLDAEIFGKSEEVILEMVQAINNCKLIEVSADAF